jgi:hypothetical protein
MRQSSTADGRVQIAGDLSHHRGEDLHRRLPVRTSPREHHLRPDARQRDEHRATVEAIRAKHERLRADPDSWEHLSTSTDFDPV